MGTRKSTDATQVSLLRPDQINAAPSDNPRFWGDGDSRPTAKAVMAMAKEYFDSKEFTGLCAALDKTGGPVSPIVVEDAGDGTYNLLDGWGRHEWARRKYARNPRIRIKAVVHPCEDDKKRVTLRVALNTARRDYSPLATAAALDRVIKAYDGSLSEAAKAVGMPRSTVALRLNLVRLPVEIKRLLKRGDLLLAASHEIIALAGFAEHSRRVQGETLSSDDAVKADQFLAACLHIAKAVDDNARDPNKKKQAMTPRGVWRLYNAFIGRKLRLSSKKSAKKLTPAQKALAVSSIIQTCPPCDVVQRCMQVYSRYIVDELLGETPDAVIVNQSVDAIVHIGFSQGWSCPIDLIEENVDSEGEPVYTDAVAMAMNEDLVRDMIVEAYMEQEHRIIPTGHELEDAEKFGEFKRRYPASTITQMRALLGAVRGATAQAVGAPATA